MPWPLLPCLGLRCQGLEVRHPPVQALAAEHQQLYLGRDQPTAAPGCDVSSLTLRCRSLGHVAPPVPTCAQLIYLPARAPRVRDLRGFVPGRL
jgi:hypothetical protein